LCPEDISEECIAKAKFLYITGITPALSDTSCEAVFTAIDYAKKHGVQVVFDPNIRKKLWSEEKARSVLLKISKVADIVLPGISEGEFLFGATSPQKIARAFLDKGASLVIVKLGAEGASFFTENESGNVPGYKVSRVVDPVGAGDGFAAGVLSGLLEGLSIKGAIQRGCAVGAMVTTVNGDIEGLPDRKLLEQFIHSTEDINR
jgi:2-dehydro-3-deoxygluconokinase